MQRKRGRESGPQRDRRLWIALTAAAGVASAFWGPILIPFLVGAAAARWLTADRQDAVSKAVAETAALLWCGLVFVCAALLVLNAWPGGVNPGQVDTAEATLARIRLHAETWPTDSIVIQLLIVTPILIVVALLCARLQRALRGGQVAFGRFKAILVVLGTFVIYGQVPLQQALARERSWIHTQFRAALGSHREAVERELLRRAQVQATTALLHNLDQLSHQHLVAFARNASTIYSEVQTREQQSDQPVRGVYLIEDATQLQSRELQDIWRIVEHVFAIPPPQAAFASDSSRVPAAARSVGELDRQLRELESAQDAATAAERWDDRRERPLGRALQQARSSLTEALTRLLPSWIGAGASTLIGILADALGESWLDRILAHFKQSTSTPQVDAAALSPGDLARLDSQLAAVEPTPNQLHAGLLSSAQLAEVIDNLVPAPSTAPSTAAPPQLLPRSIDAEERGLIQDEIDRHARPLDISSGGE